MNRIKAIVIAALSAVAFGALIAPVAAQAEEPHFVTNKFGELVGKGGPVVWHLGYESNETVECKKESLRGTWSDERIAYLPLLAVHYEECEADTFLGNAPASVSNAEYRFWADGKADLENTVTIKEIDYGLIQIIPPQAGLTTVTYENVSGKINIDSSLTGLASEGDLGPSVAGTYSGDARVELIGGTMEWSR